MRLTLSDCGPGCGDREVVHEGLLLEPGYAYNVVPHAHRHAREGKFILRLFAKQVRRTVGRWSADWPARSAGAGTSGCVSSWRVLATADGLPGRFRVSSRCWWSACPTRTASS